MAIKVRLKDAEGQILHPETDWSVVQNKPSIKVNADGSEIWGGQIGKNITVQTMGKLSLSGSAETAVGSSSETRISGAYVNLSSAGSYIHLTAASEIAISDGVTGHVLTSLKNYPINYNAINGTPTFYLINYDNIGYYEHRNYMGESTTSLACKFTSSTQSGGAVEKYFYLNSNGTWTSFSLSNIGTESTTYTAVSCLRKK